MQSVSTGQYNWSAFLEDINTADPVMSKLKERCLWRAPIGWVCTDKYEDGGMCFSICVKFLYHIV